MINMCARVHACMCVLTRACVRASVYAFVRPSPCLTSTQCVGGRTFVVIVL